MSHDSLDDRLLLFRQGFEEKYFIPSHIQFDADEFAYKSRYSDRGEVFKKLEVQTNNMYAIWIDACCFTTENALGKK